MKIFYDQVPVGGKLRMFGSGDGRPATNFRRWRNYAWRSVEPEGQTKAKEWTPEKAARLKNLVDKAHKDGYWIRFYTLDGDPFPATHGWSPDYNFGTLEAAQIRWRACIEAGVDFVATDQFEAFTEFLKHSQRKPR